jgi:hypothetical protein
VFVMQVCYSDSRASDSFERVKLDKNTPFLTSSDEGNSPDSLNVLFKQKKHIHKLRTLFKMTIIYRGFLIKNVVSKCVLFRNRPKGEQLFCESRTMGFY